MDNGSDQNQEEKSPKERFLLIIGILFFLVYLALGLAVIFWEKFPLQMEYRYRIAFGVLLIVYAAVRFSRIIKTDRE